MEEGRHSCKLSRPQHYYINVSHQLYSLITLTEAKEIQLVLE